MESSASQIIAERLRETMKIRGITSVQLARMAGLKTSFLYDILRNKSHNPSIIRLARVAETLDIPLSHLMGDGSAPAMPTHLPTEETVVIPFISVENKSITISDTTFAPLMFNAQWLREHVGKPENLRLFAIKTDAMQPTLNARDMVLIDTTKKDPSPKSIFVIRQGNELMARRIKPAKTAGKVELLCDNPAYLPETRSFASMEIAGSVVWISRFI